ncbi:disulfide bond formation protein B [Insolitispirillum peregrinum]|uniref:Disulfide bond formation protein DsbB n=1 Tax=Insolitispirillum peregrinum TaxID=80876 RepID=A0A1N7PWL9_9PROT|nr:disulfide bond formation protein B [Insolitispirillum peregrinum]SIT14998.1 Disulfide bond formation protein DsbB [Insolitispirillum peregrinum]
MTRTQSRPLFMAIALSCAMALTAALIGEKVYGLRPCLLCLYERVPYVVAGMVSLLLIAAPTSARLRWLGIGLVLLAFLANLGLGVFHVGVESHWWASPACTAETSAAPTSLADMQAALTQPPPPPCDEVQWRLFGISLAGYNTLYNLVLFVCTLVALRRLRSAEE